MQNNQINFNQNSNYTNNLNNQAYKNKTIGYDVHNPNYQTDYCNDSLEKNPYADYYQNNSIPQTQGKKKSKAFLKFCSWVLGIAISANVLPAALIHPNTSNPNNLSNKDLRTLYVSGALVDKLDGESTKDFTIDYTEQGKTADCWLLSVINSINETEKGKEFFKNMFEYKKDETIVHLHVGDYTITNDELKIGKVRNSKGDDDVLLIELAVEKALADYNNGKITLPEAVITEELGGNGTFSTLNLGSQDAGIFILTGNSAEYLPIEENEEKINDYFKAFASDKKADMSVTASIETGDTTFTNQKGEEISLRGHHAYTVKSIDENGTVTISNPDLSEEEIKMNYETFKNIFSSITVADISNIA